MNGVAIVVYRAMPALRCSRQSAESSTERGVLTALVATTQGLEIFPMSAYVVDKSLVYG